MPTYITLVKWTDQGIKDAKNAITRTQRSEGVAEKAGGRVIATWWTQGAYDQIIVAEYPDDETASAVILGIATQGNIHTQTMRAYTADEMQRILQKLS